MSSLAERLLEVRRMYDTNQLDPAGKFWAPITMWYLGTALIAGTYTCTVKEINND